MLRANYDGDINGFSLEFRKDGTYKFCNYSVLGGKYFRGKYLLKDSIITLDRNNIDDVIIQGGFSGPPSVNSQINALRFYIINNKTIYIIKSS